MSLSTRTSTAPSRRLRTTSAVLVLLMAIASALLMTAPSASAAAGRFDLTPGHGASRGTGVAVGDGSVAATFTVPRLGGDQYFGVSVRNQGDALGYRSKLRVFRDGAVSVALVRVGGGTETVLARRALAGKVAPGDAMRIQVAAIGTSSVGLGLRAWRVGTNMPGWTLRATDSSAQRIARSGEGRSWAYLSGTAPTGVSVKYDDLAVSTSKPTGLTGQTTATPTPAPARTTVTTGIKRSASNTGVPAGTALTRHDGNITVTKAGTVLSNLDIHGLVVIKAANVTIKNSILRGGRPTTNQGMLTNYGYTNLLVTDTSFIPQYQTVYQDGMKGWNYTLRRVHITGNVDSAKVQGDNVTIEDSLLENTVHYAHDPAQGGGPSHSDGIQIQRGANVVIRNNTLRGHSNFAILGAAALANTPNLQLVGNWVDGGHCTIKLQELSGHSLSVNASSNKFGPNREVQSCPLVAVRGVQVTAASNVFEQTGKPVSVYWTDS